MNHDKYGYCALCHECLLVPDKNEKGQPIIRLSGKAEHKEVKLSDGSLMRVLLCQPCKSSYSHDTHSNELMNSVIRGWEVECDQLVADESKPQFDSKWKENYMKVYSEKEIVS